eukprot:Colp12_sorted_trinity150504_noHs@13905
MHVMYRGTRNCLQRLAGEEEEHGSEDAKLATLHKVVSSAVKHLADLGGARRGDLAVFESRAEHLSGKTAGGATAEALNGPPLGASKGEVPGNLARMLHDGAIFKLDNLETDGLEGVDDLLEGGELREAVADLDALLHTAVVGVAGIIDVGDAPLVCGEALTRLESAEHLSIAANLVGGVASGLDGVDAVEGVLREGKLHEVTLDKSALTLKTTALVVELSALDLVLVVVDANNRGAREGGDLTHGTTDTATNIKGLAVGIKLELQGKVVLVAGKRLLHRLLEAGAGSEVEALRPAIFEEVSHKVVVVVDHLLVLLLAGLNVTSLLLVVEEVEVLVGGGVEGLLVERSLELTSKELVGERGGGRHLRIL